MISAAYAMIGAAVGFGVVYFGMQRQWEDVMLVLGAGFVAILAVIALTWTPEIEPEEDADEAS